MKKNESCGSRSCDLINCAVFICAQKRLHEPCSPVLCGNRTVWVYSERSWLIKKVLDKPQILCYNEYRN